MAGMVLVFYVDAFLVGAPIHLALPFALLGVVVLVGFLQHADHGPVGTIRATTPLIAGLAALAVLGLTRGLAMPVVLSAAAVGSIGGLAEVAARGRMVGLGAAVYCGAFAGMTSELVLVHPAGVLLAGAVAGLLLELLQGSWAGIGGKLGSTAFLGVLSVCGVALALGRLGPGVRLHSYSAPERLAVVLVALLAPQITHRLSYGSGTRQGNGTGQGNGKGQGIGVVLGSALPSLLAGALLPAPLAAVWMGGSFVGMSAPPRLAPHPRLLLLAMGLLFGLFSLGFEPTLAGIGGDLGATAAMAVFAVLGLRRLLPGRPS
jgi:hypothetical protein